jgi:hypothetical protein
MAHDASPRRPKKQRRDSRSAAAQEAHDGRRPRRPSIAYRAEIEDKDNAFKPLTSWKSDKTKSAPTLDALRDRMEALRRDQNALRERMASFLRDCRELKAGCE